MGLCLFREAENDEKIVQIAEWKTKFNAVIRKPDNLHQECRFLWVQMKFQDEDCMDKADVMNCTQKFLDQTEGGDETSLDNIDRIINALPEAITFEIFKLYVKDVMQIIDNELTRRYSHAMEMSNSLCGSAYEVEIQKEHYCYNAHQKIRQPFVRTMYVATEPLPPEAGFQTGLLQENNMNNPLYNPVYKEEYSRQNPMNPPNMPMSANSMASGFDNMSYSQYSSIHGGSAYVPGSTQMALNKGPAGNTAGGGVYVRPPASNMTNPYEIGNQSKQNIASDIYAGQPFGRGTSESLNNTFDSIPPPLYNASLGGSNYNNSSLGPGVYQPVSQSNLNNSLHSGLGVPGSSNQLYSSNPNVPPAVAATLANGSAAPALTVKGGGAYDNVEQVRDALLEEGVLMQVFNSSYDLEWKYIKFQRAMAGRAPTKIELCSPQTKIAMTFALAELQEVERGRKCLSLCEDVAEAAKNIVNDPEGRLAAFIFGQDGFLIVVFPDATIADLCFKAFKTFGMNVRTH